MARRGKVKGRRKRIEREDKEHRVGSTQHRQNHSITAFKGFIKLWHLS